MAIALFFFSCEDENSILGFRNQSPKFNVSYVEIPIASNVQLIDSIITDNKNAAGNILIGKYRDQVFGDVTAESFLQIYPVASAGGATVPDDAIFDSLTLSIRLSFYGYGIDGKKTQTFTIHELTDTLDRSSKRYFFDSPGISRNVTPLTSASVEVISDSLRKEFLTASNRQDTLLIRAKLSDELGKRIFKYLQSYSFSSSTASSEIRDFLSSVKGLALVPVGENGIIGLKIFDNLSGVRVHYRTVSNGAVKDTLTRSLAFSTPSFTKISVDRQASPLAGAVINQSLTEMSTTGQRYIQAGNPVITRLDLDNFYRFADTVGNVLVNEASIVVDGVETPLQNIPFDELSLKVMNAENKFSNYALAETDRAHLSPYVLSNANTSGILLLDGKNYFIRSDVPSNPVNPAALSYSSGQYKTYITLLLQQLLKFRNDKDGINDTRLRYLALFPLTPANGASVTRTVFPASGIKLKIYYTKPTFTVNP